MFLESSSEKSDLQITSRQRSISPFRDSHKKSQSQGKESPTHHVDRMTAEHIHRHLQQFRPQENSLLLPPAQSESSSPLNMQSFFKNGNDEGASKENKSSAVSTNGNTLKSAFSIRSLLSGGVDSKDGVAGHISNEFSHHLSRLAAPFGHIYNSKHLETKFNSSSESRDNSHGNEDFVDVDGGIIDDDEDEDIDLEEDESIDNNEDSKCDDGNGSEDDKETSSLGDDKKDGDKEENLTPEEKEKVYCLVIS